MEWGLRSKEEIENVLRAAQTAVLATAQRLPASPELEVYLDGYAAALSVVAQGLGVQLDVEPLRSLAASNRAGGSRARFWDTDGRLLPASLLEEPWPITDVDESGEDY